MRWPKSRAVRATRLGTDGSRSRRGAASAEEANRDAVSAVAMLVAMITRVVFLLIPLQTNGARVRLRAGALPRARRATLDA